MSMTIEELVYSFAIRQFHKAPINTERDLMCVCSDFANEFLAQPLSSRLTTEEKERVRTCHKLARDGYWECNCADKAVVKVLESIFGADFFKEEE
jgi:hypothetical protein